LGLDGRDGSFGPGGDGVVRRGWECAHMCGKRGFVSLAFHGNGRGQARASRGGMVGRHAAKGLWVLSGGTPEDTL
jgi:hypothetical protein